MTQAIGATWVTLRLGSSRLMEGMHDGRVAEVLKAMGKVGTPQDAGASMLVDSAKRIVDVATVAVLGQDMYVLG